MSRSIILVVSTILVSSAVAYGQSLPYLDDTRSNVRHQLGVRGGLNFTKVRFNPTVEQNYTQGILFGVAYGFMSTKAAGVVVELLYAQYGWDEKFDDESQHYQRTMSYIEMPILSNFIIGRRKGHLKFNFGPRFAYLLNESEETNIQGSDTPYYYGRPIEDNIELGLTFGAGYSRVLSAGEIEFDIRYSMTFSNMFETPDDLELLYSQNVGISVSLVYWLPNKS